MTEYWKSNNLQNPRQQGFIAWRSYLSQLLDHYDKILDAFEENKNNDAIYADSAKAFE